MAQGNEVFNSDSFELVVDGSPSADVGVGADLSSAGEAFNALSTEPVLIGLIIFAVVMISTIIIYNFSGGRKRALEHRKKQTVEGFRENVIKARLEDIIDKRVKQSKRFETETLIMQAGIKLSYVELVLVSILTSIVLGALALFMSKHILLGIVFAFVGYLLPKQMIGMLRNRRVIALEEQVGIFIEMFVYRYEMNADFKKAFQTTVDEFEGQEPIYNILRDASIELDLGKSSDEIMDGLAHRTGNQFMFRLADFYKVASTVGTDDVRRELLHQVVKQFKEHERTKSAMKRELATVKRNAYLLLAVLPGFAIFQSISMDGYVEFMTQTLMGQIGTAVITLVFIFALWFINKKIAGPLE